MSQINLNLNSKEYLPGQLIEGTATWNLDKQPKSIEVRLFWYTQGKGTEDSQLIDTFKAGNSSSQGECVFKLKVPVGPYSFSGKLISLIWAVEFVALPSNDCKRENITISPTGKEILLNNI